MNEFKHWSNLRTSILFWLQIFLIPNLHKTDLQYNYNLSFLDNYGTSFFCRMRVYHSLRGSGFGVRNKRTIYKVRRERMPICYCRKVVTCSSFCKVLHSIYCKTLQPCKIILKFHDPSSMEDTASTCGPNSSLLLAEVIPIEAAYKGNIF